MQQNNSFLGCIIIFGYIFAVITTIITIIYSILMVIPLYPFTELHTDLALILIILSIFGFIPFLGYIFGIVFGVTLFGFISLISCCCNKKVNNTPKFKIIQIETNSLLNEPKKQIYNTV